MSDARLRVRRAVMADAEAIARVHVAAWRAAYAGVVPDRYLVAMSQAGQARQWRRLLGRSRVRETVLVAEALIGGNREVVGFGNCGPVRPCGLSYAGEVYTLYVAGDWQDHALLPAPVANNAVTTHVLADTPYVYTFMGIDSTKIWSGITTEARRLNAVTNAWETLPDVPAPDGRIAACAVTLGDSVYVIGGYKVDSGGGETTARRMMRFDATTATWVDDAALVGHKVDDMVAATWRDSHIFLISGWSTNQNVAYVQVYDRATDTWADATPIPDFGTFGAVGGICGDHIVFMDGVADTGSFSFDLVNRVLVGTIDPGDPTNVTWEDRGPHPGAPVYRGASWNLPGDDDRILVAGGTDNPYNFNGQGYGGQPAEPLPTVWSYHVPTGTVVFHADKPVPTMDHRGFPPAGGRLWVIGGMEGGQTVTARVSSWLPDAVTGIQSGLLEGTAPGLPVVRAWPNPVRTEVRFAPSLPGAVLERARIIDVTGRVVRRFDASERADGGGIRWNLENRSGRRVAPGVYWLSGQVSGRHVFRSVVVADR